MFPDGSVCDDYNLTHATYTKCLDAVNHTNQLTHTGNGNALKKLESCVTVRTMSSCMCFCEFIPMFLGFFCLGFKAKNEINTVSQIKRVSGSKL